VQRAATTLSGLAQASAQRQRERLVARYEVLQRAAEHSTAVYHRWHVDDVVLLARRASIPLAAGLLILLGWFLLGFRRATMRSTVDRQVGTSYAFGVGLSVVLLLPLLTPANGAELEPLRPFRTFTSSSWYLPAFATGAVRPILHSGAPPAQFQATPGAPGNITVYEQPDTIDIEALVAAINDLTIAVNNRPDVERAVREGLAADANIRRIPALPDTAQLDHMLSVVRPIRGDN